MSPRKQFLADCAELWDKSDDHAVFAFGMPGSKVGLFTGPMTVHTWEGWFCIRLGHDEANTAERLLGALRAHEGAPACH
jgi:hypothetical protein